MLICDFHVHSTASHDCGMKPHRIVELAQSRGLDTIVVCDHDTIRGAIAVRSAAAAMGSPVQVVVGSEIRTRDGEVIGVFLTDEIAGRMSAVETADSILAQGGLVLVPHPFDRHRSSAISPQALDDIAQHVDAVEGLNARNLRGADDRRARQWARDHGIACVAGSDAHSYGEVGRVRTVLPEFRDAAGLRTALADVRVEGRRSSPFVHVPTLVQKRLRGSVLPPA